MDLELSAAGSQNEGILYLLVEQFLRREGLDEQLLAQYRAWLEQHGKLRSESIAQPRNTGCGFEEFETQIAHRATDISRTWAKLEQLVASDDCVEEIVQTQLVAKARAKFQEYIAQLSDNCQNPRSLLRRPRALAHEKRQRAKFLVTQYKKLHTTVGHAHSPQSGLLYADSEEPYIPIHNIQFDKSGKVLVTADAEGLIKVWSAETGLLLSNLKGHQKQVNALDFSPCNR